MPFRSPQKVKQQRRVLLLALYLLKRRYGVDPPPKYQVLNFISLRRLMHVPADDSDYRSTGDEIWENDLAWKRADLKKDGLLDMPKYGFWQITKRGEEDVEAWAQHVKEISDKDPTFAERFKFDPNHSDFEFYMTPETFKWAVKIATGTLHDPA
jgi:hypothetical protein